MDRGRKEAKPMNTETLEGIEGGSQNQVKEEENKSLLGKKDQREAVTVDLAARLLGKSRDTVYRWLDEGRLAGRKVGGTWLVYRDTIEEEWRAGLVEHQRKARRR